MKTTDTTKSSQKTTTWSLQDNKRTEAERNAFKPTGKTPKNKTLKYVLGVIVVLFSLSYALVQIYKEPLQTCLTSDFCINSIDDRFLYTLFIFLNMAIVILAFVGTYILGRKLQSYMKR